MRTVNFEVKQQRIKPIDSVTHIYSGTDNYLELKFKFNNDWDACIKGISFIVGNNELPMLLKNDSCVVPEEAFDKNKLAFYLVGKKKDYRIQSQKFTIKIGG